MFYIFFQKPNLILNVDGIIGVAFVDLLRSSGVFTMEEANEFVEIGTLNGLFVLGRSMGFIGENDFFPFLIVVLQKLTRFCYL